MKLTPAGFLVGVVLFAGAAAPGRALQEFGTVRAEFRPRCLFATEGLYLDLWDVEGSLKLLRQHAIAHGWREWYSGCDFVPAGEGARCPAPILDSMAAARDLAERGTDGRYLYPQLATALLSNGRADEALALLAAAHQDAQREDGPHAYLHVSFHAQSGAKIAARAGRWATALEFAATWRSTSTCSLGASSEHSELVAFRAWCLVETGRYAQAIEWVRENPEEIGWTAGAWLEAEIAAGRARDVDQALDSILAQAPPAMHDFCRTAAESYKLARAQRDEQWSSLKRLAIGNPSLAWSLLLSAQRFEIAGLLDAFEVVDGRLREPGLAHLLMDLGLPEVETALARAKEQMKGQGHADRLEFELGLWKAANARWLVLTEGQR